MIYLTHKTIHLDNVGTIAIMDYLDSHPSERCDYTTFTDGFTTLMVSEYSPDSIDIESLKRGIIKWYKLPNGWERSYSGGLWKCKKNNRWIIITD